MNHPAKHFPPLRRGAPLPPHNPKRDSEAIIFHQQPQTVVVRLPRSGQGKTPRKGVHIPLHPHSKAAIASRAKVSKHARQQRKDGKFGNKGAKTLERKAALLAGTRIQALYVAAQRAVERITNATKLGIGARLDRAKQIPLKARERFYSTLRAVEGKAGEVEA